MSPDQIIYIEQPGGEELVGFEWFTGEGGDSALGSLVGILDWVKKAFGIASTVVSFFRDVLKPGGADVCIRDSTCDAIYVAKTGELSKGILKFQKTTESQCVGKLVVPAERIPGWVMQCTPSSSATPGQRVGAAAGAWFKQNWKTIAIIAGSLGAAGIGWRIVSGGRRRQAGAR